jgi:hypothetical protein
MPFCAATARCCAATLSCCATNILLKDNRWILIFLLLAVYNFELPIDVIYCIICWYNASAFCS